MNFLEHFEELRSRLFRCLFVFSVGFVGFYFISDLFLEFLNRPLFEAMPLDQRKLYFTHLFENFMTHLKVSGVASLFFLSPYYFYELWAFVAPGLLPKERRLLIPFALSASFFFLGGAAFAYYVLFPVGFRYFVHFGSEDTIPLLTMDSYYGTCLKLLLTFGLAFELPVFIVLLGVLGVVNAESLRQNRRTAILIITFISAVVAPPDALSMILLGVPLIGLYEVALWIVSKISPPPSFSEPDPFVGKSQDFSSNP